MILDPFCLEMSVGLLKIKIFHFGHYHSPDFLISQLAQIPKKISGGSKFGAGPRGPKFPDFRGSAKKVRISGNPRDFEIGIFDFWEQVFTIFAEFYNFGPQL